MAEEHTSMEINHSERYLYGAGNDGKSGYEGVVYKNVIGTLSAWSVASKESTGE